MKKFMAILLTMLLAVSLVACSQTGKDTKDSSENATNDSSNASDSSDAGKKPVAGMTFYMYSDTHMSNIRNSILKLAEQGPIDIQTADSKNDVATQMNNISTFVANGSKYLAVCNVALNAKQEVIDQCKEAGLPTIFYNTSCPSDEEMASYDKLYYVSTKAEQSGAIQGEAAAKYWKEHPEADRNGNGKMDYVMLIGQIGNYDSDQRTKVSVETVNKAGIETNKLNEVVANWQRADAQDAMASMITSLGDDIEVVFANNDDMALGAINALKAAGYFQGNPGDAGYKYVPVLGIDATATGVEAIKDGTMLATCFNDPVLMSKTIYKMLMLFDEGKEVNEENLGLPVDNRKVWLDFKAITKDNVDEATIDINNVKLD